MLIFHLESWHRSWLFHLVMNQWMQVTWQLFTERWLAVLMVPQLCGGHPRLSRNSHRKDE